MGPVNMDWIFRVRSRESRNECVIWPEEISFQRLA
jgi:hypothetical protein